MAKFVQRADYFGDVIYPGTTAKSHRGSLFDALRAAGAITSADRTVITASRALTVADCGTLLVDATAGNIVLTLPASGVGADEALYEIDRLDATANTVTVAAAGADTVAGAADVAVVGTMRLRLPAGKTDWRVHGLGGATPAKTREALGVTSGDFDSPIINGGMAIDQRNNGAAQTIIAGSAVLAFCVDRWFATCLGANVTGQRVAGSGKSKYRYRFTGAASVSNIYFGQRISANNSYHLNDSQVRLSVDLANSLLTTVAWALYYSNTSDAFGTIAAPTKTLIANGTFTVSATVARHHTLVTLPAGATTGLEVLFSVGAQISGTWTIGDAKLAPVASDSAFKHTPDEIEMDRCLPCYERGNAYYEGYASAASQPVGGAIRFRKEKRVLPTMTYGAFTSVQNAQVGATRATYTDSVERYALSVATGTVTGREPWAASAEIL